MMEIIQLSDDDGILHKIRRVQEILEKQAPTVMMLPEMFVTSGPVAYRLSHSGATGIKEIDTFYKREGAMVLVSQDEEHSVTIFLNNYPRMFYTTEELRQMCIEAAQLRALDFIDNIIVKAQKRSSQKAIKPRKNRAKKPVLTRRIMPCNLFR